MKTINCLAITEYKKCPVAILNFDYSFIQLFVHKGVFYYRHDFFKPSVFYRIKWKLGIAKFPFPPEELAKMKSAILQDAFDRIDELLTNQKT